MARSGPTTALAPIVIVSVARAREPNNENSVRRQDERTRTAPNVGAPLSRECVSCDAVAKSTVRDDVVLHDRSKFATSMILFFLKTKKKSPILN